MPRRAAASPPPPPAQLAKRPRRDRASDYVPGSVIKVHMHNFMTYQDCVVRPGPRLNLVLGPNGSGKSSLVCALCVGLAGSTKLLGRADNVRDFVKHGCARGFTEVTLSQGPGRPAVIIKRKMKKGEGGKGTSTWQLDGEPSTETKVKDVVAGLGIQVDNLCQFLPQDKVVAFAQLSPDALLLETEKALGDSTLYDLHQKLIESNSGLRDVKKQFEKHSARLETLKEQNEELRNNVEKAEERTKLEDELKLCAYKLPWVKVQTMAERVKAGKEEFAASKAVYVAAKTRLEKHSGPVNELRQEQSALERADRQFVQEKKEHHDRAKRDLKHMQRAEKDVEDRQDRRRQIEEDLGRREATLQGYDEKEGELVERLAELEEERERMGGSGMSVAEQQRLHEIEGEMADLSEKIRAATQDQQKTTNQKARVGYEIQALHRRIQEQDSAKYKATKRLMHYMPQDTANLEQAQRWIHENRSKFRGEVLGPIAAEMQVSDNTYAAYLEQQIPNWLFRAFVTTHPEDDRLLRDESKKRGWKLDMVTYGGDPNEPIKHPDGEASAYARFGILHTLDETFKAPAVIKRLLCDFALIQKTYVGSQETQRQIEQASANRSEPEWQASSMSSLWTPKYNYRKQTSRYQQGTAVLSGFEVRPARLLGTGGAGADEVGELRHHYEQLRGAQKDLENQYAEAKARYDQLNDVFVELSNERSDLLNKKKVINNKLRRANTELRELRSQRKMLLSRATKEQELEEVDQKIAQLVGELGTRAVSGMRAALAEADCMARSWGSTFAKEERRAQVQAWNRLNRDLRKAVEDAKRATEKLQTEAKQQVKEYQRLKKLTEKEYGLTRDIKARLEGLPATEAELEDRIGVLEASINQIIVNSDDLEEFQRVEIEIRELQKKVEAEGAELEGKESYEAGLRGQWLPPLRDLVDKVNATFTRNFAQIGKGCAGEIRLHEADKYEHFEVQIWLKFRAQSELALLTSSHQSGGERSVATILYLISIQDLTAVPFRVIDEINQGMDPRNERLVFKQLVESSCRPGTPQCFLLTPKLLPELSYHKDVTALNIFNGPHVPEAAGEWERDDIWGFSAGGAFAAPPGIAAN